jgi:hypothetical protein
VLRSDPGSDFTSNVVTQLLTWLGPTQSLTLVNRPQADGVERLNREILKRITILCMEDAELRSNWSDISVYLLVQYVINNSKHSETGFTPFQLQFATLDGRYFDIPKLMNSDQDSSNSIIHKLCTNLEKIRSISHEYQNKLKDKRRIVNSYTTYQIGTFVLVMGEKSDRKDKLYAVNFGPYKVVQHIDNNVTLESLIDGKHQVVHVSKLKIFFGTEKDAFNCAKMDDDQVNIITIISYRGNYLKRTTCEFLVQFVDNTEKWLTFKEVCDTKPFEDFCQYPIYLNNLLLSSSQVNEEQSRMNKQIITIEKGAKAYINIRTFNYEWYEQLQLPNHVTYLIKMILNIINLK